MNSFKAAVYQQLAGIDTTPHQPPGMGKLTTIVGWSAWGVGFIALLGFLGGLVYMITCAYRGDEINGVKPSLICLVVAVVAGGAGAIFNPLT